jgi:Tfp pilus assembly protein PilO
MKPATKSRHILNKREASLIALVIIFVIALIVWQAVGRNLHKEIALLHEKSSSLTSEIAGLEEILSRKDSIESSWAQLHEEEARLNRVLPEISELPLVLEELGKVVESFNRQIKAFQADEIVTYDSHTELPFTLNAEGLPYQIRAIIKALEAFPHLLTIDYLHWTSIDDQEAALDIYFRIHFYNGVERSY